MIQQTTAQNTHLQHAERFVERHGHGDLGEILADVLAQQVEERDVAVVRLRCGQLAASSRHRALQWRHLRTWLRRGDDRCVLAVAEVAALFLLFLFVVGTLLRGDVVLLRVVELRHRLAVEGERLRDDTGALKNTHDLKTETLKIHKMIKYNCEMFSATYRTGLEYRRCGSSVEKRRLLLGKLRLFDIAHVAVSLDAAESRSEVVVLTHDLRQHVRCTIECERSLRSNKPPWKTPSDWPRNWRRSQALVRRRSSTPASVARVPSWSCGTSAWASRALHRWKSRECHDAARKMAWRTCFGLLQKLVARNQLLLLGVGGHHGRHKRLRQADWPRTPLVTQQVGTRRVLMQHCAAVGCLQQENMKWNRETFDP